MKTAIMLSLGGESGHKNLLNAYGAETRAELEENLTLLPEITTESDLYNRAAMGQLYDVSYLFTTWGMTAQMESNIRQYAPKLEAIFYAAGSVQGFAKPYMNLGIKVYSAYRANAVPVAEYTLAQIILAGKGYFQAERIYRQEKNRWLASAYSHEHSGNYGQTIGLLGAGAIGKLVIDLLKPFNYKIIVFDPFLPESVAADLGVELVDLETLFSESEIISNHLANNAETVGMLNYELFSRMKTHATFINTGRGATVVEADLIRSLEEVSSRTAVLDVTWPEPPLAESPLYVLPNVFLTPHIAGSQRLEIRRMGEYMLDAWRAHEAGAKSEHEVTVEMLTTMA